MPSNRLQAVAFVLLIALALLAAGLLLAACGGSSSPSGDAASASDNALQFSRCMREHGVKNFPNPETTAAGATRLQFKVGEGVSPKTMEAAQEACKHFQEEGGEGKELSPQQKVEAEENVQKFAKCMREHGIEVETSTSGGGVQIKVGGPGASGPNPQSPAFQGAQEACQGLMPGPKGGPGGPTTSKAPGSGEQSLQAESSSGEE